MNLSKLPQLGMPSQEALALLQRPRRATVQFHGLAAADASQRNKLTKVKELLMNMIPELPTAKLPQVMEGATQATCLGPHVSAYSSKLYRADQLLNG